MMDGLSLLTPKEVISLAFAISLSIADDLSLEEQFAIGTFLISIGTLLNNIAAQRVFLNSLQPATTNTEIKELKKDVQGLKKDLQKLNDMIHSLSAQTNPTLKPIK